jgi:hypothetical protein
MKTSGKQRMHDLIDKAKEIYEKVKPVFMSETNSDPEAKQSAPDAKPEMFDKAAIPGVTIKEEESSPLKKTRAPDIITAIINGAGVGLLLGTLLGLSISPVVSGVIGTLSGLLAVLLGTSEKYMGRMKSIRIGTFGFFCVAGVMLGIHIRTNNAMMPDRGKMMLDYRKVGFSKQEALDFIAFREFGLVPAGWKVEQHSGKASTDPGSKKPADTSSRKGEQNPKVQKVHLPAEDKAVETVHARDHASETSGRVFANANATGAERQSLLYSSEINASACYLLNYANITQPAEEVRDKFERAGGTWKEMADVLKTELPEKVYVQALLTIRDCFCKQGQSGVLKITTSARIKQLNNSQSLEQIQKVLSDAGGSWTELVEKINTDIPVEFQKSLFLSLIKIFKS